MCEREFFLDNFLLCDKQFFIDNLLVPFHFIIEMIWWTGLALWELKFPFSGSLTSTFLTCETCIHLSKQHVAKYGCFFFFLITLKPRVE